MTRYTPQWLQSGSYAGSQDRRLVGALWPVPASTGCAVTAASGMTVNVAAGQVAVPTQNNTGSTLCSSDAMEAVGPLSAAPGSGTNRIDLIVCRPRGTDLDGGGNNDFIFDFVTGVAAATPSPPATPAGTVALAQIYITGGSAAISGANITDMRPGALAVPAGLPATAPRGYVASAIGPSTTISGIGTTLTNVLALTATTTAGRRYRLTITTALNQVTTAGSTLAQLADTTNIDSGQARVLFAYLSLGVNTSTAVFLHSPTTTGARTWTLQASTSAGTVNAAANQTTMLLEDIGSQ